MDTFEIKRPNGDVYRVTGNSAEEANAVLEKYLSEAGTPAPQEVAQQPKEEKTTHTGGLSAHATQGALASFGDEYMAGLSSVLGVQPDGQGGANWFDYSKPIGERYSTALDQIRTEMGEYRDENPKKAAAAQIGGAIGTAVAGAAALPAQGAQATTRVGRGVQAIMPKAATTTAGKAGQLAKAGAIGGAIEGFGAGEGGGAERLKSAAVGGVVGAVFAPVVGFGIAAVAKQAEKIGGKALRSVFTNKRLYSRNTGRLTDAGKKRLADLGYDAAQLSDEMQRAFGVAAEDATGDGAAATGATVGRMAQAERFGVPITKGQATGDVVQTAAEENFRAGTRGQTAYDTIKGFDARQATIVDDARANIVPGSVDAIDAADSVISGVKREAESARLAGRAAYEALDESGAGISGGSIGELTNRIAVAARSEGVPIDAGTPNANAALAVLDDAFKGAEAGSVPFASIERARQRMLAFSRAADRGSNGPDQVAIGTAIREFDDWLDDTITTSLIQGDEAALGQAKEARTLWAKYRTTFLSREGADNFVRKIVQDDLAPDQVAGWLFGASKNIGGGQTSLVAKRIKGILGEESAEWASVRSAAWTRATTATAGKDALGPQAVASSISELLDGKGKTLSRELFTDQERLVMGEFRDMLKVLVPPKKATNPSGSGYEVQRAVQAMTEGLGSVIGGGTAGPVGAVAGRQAVKTGSNFSATLQARAASRGVKFNPTSPAVAIGAGVGAGAAVQNELIR